MSTANILFIIGCVLSLGGLAVMAYIMFHDFVKDIREAKE